MQKKALAVAISGALATPMAAQAIDITFSGQVNRAVQWLSDGEGTAFQFVGNDASGTRFRFRGSEELGNGITAGLYGEWQSTSNPASGVTVKGNDTSNRGFSNRQANIWFSNNWGKITLGQTNSASDGGTEANLSGAWITSNVARTTYGGGVAWRTSNGGRIGATTPGGAGGLTVADTYAQGDGNRQDVLRYDSPSLGPLTLAANVGNDEQWEAAARVGGSLFGGDYSGAVFYADRENASNVKNMGGSLSYLFGFGLSISGAYAYGDVEDGENTNMYFGQVGYRWGNNAINVDASSSEDATPGFTMTSYSVGYQYNLPKPRMELYAGGILHKLDTPGGVGSTQDIIVLTTGTRIRF